jgi:hypothetical protein
LLKGIAPIKAKRLPDHREDLSFCRPTFRVRRCFNFSAYLTVLSKLLISRAYLPNMPAFPCRFPLVGCADILYTTPSLPNSFFKVGNFNPIPVFISDFHCAEFF